MTSRSTKRVLVFACAIGMSACALQTHDPRPLDPARSQTALLERSPADPGVRDALARHGIDTNRWPLPQWDLAALTALAFEFRTDLALARAERASIDAARLSARATRNPGIDLNAEHHSERGTNNSPWTLGLALDFAITGASRRAARGEQADALLREADWRVAHRAWQVRSQVRDAFSRLHFSRRKAEALDSELALRQQETALFEKRLIVGATSAAEPARARQREANTAEQHRAALKAVRLARIELAQAIGLAPEALERLDLSDTAPDSPVAAANGDMLQRTALNDRLDVRAALERYAASEAALQLEIARQVPEFSIRPGYSWDQGDNRWSLGFATVLPLFDRNIGPIAQARAQRDVEAARFVTLQAEAIASLDAARQAALAAQATVLATETDQARETELSARVERRFSAGDADRLERVIAQLAANAAQRRLIDARAEEARALSMLEDVVQRPLNAIPTADAPTPGSAGNRTETR